MAIRPKQFYAACNFQVGRHSFQAGDPIPDGMLLARLLHFGDRFAVASKTAPADPPPTPTAGEASSLSEKEDQP